MDVGQNRRNLWLIKQIQPCRKKNEEARCFEIKTTKHFKLIVFYATSLVVFGFGLLLFFLALLISNSCDDAAGKTARNSRGDIVKERLTICTGVGTVINHPLFCCR